MKSLIVLRHGNSNNPSGTADFDRALTHQGTEEAARTGKILAQRDLTPDLIVTSTANRAQTTARLVAESCNYTGDIIPSDQLYLPTQEHILATIRGISEDHSRVVLVGHNPGFGLFASKFGNGVFHFPTCAWSHIEFDIEHWGEISQTATSASLDFWHPSMDA